METINNNLENLNVVGDQVPDTSPSRHLEDLASSGSPAGPSATTDTTPRPVTTESEDDPQPRNHRGKRAGWRVRENMRMRLLNNLQIRSVDYMVARNIRAMNRRRPDSGGRRGNRGGAAGQYDHTEGKN
ncbi:uncharacterized protein [Venturia canescens]|uniref:uncharacterized protein n=1 Tax=Venturia canescens TaxID=32260 RepID=UPI001C9D0925|nr:uncharacterized protein LOC122410548 [Venturia canescens]